MIDREDEIIAMLDNLVAKGVGKIDISMGDVDSQTDSYNECKPGSACFSPTLMQGLDDENKED